MKTDVITLAIKSKPAIAYRDSANLALAFLNSNVVETTPVSHSTNAEAMGNAAL